MGVGKGGSDHLQGKASVGRECEAPASVSSLLSRRSLPVYCGNSQWDGGERLTHRDDSDSSCHIAVGLMEQRFNSIMCRNYVHW